MKMMNKKYNLRDDHGKRRFFKFDSNYKTETQLTFHSGNAT